MSVKLSKVTKDLNVGLSTAVEFLHKKGIKDVKENPNARITEEQYDLLLNEFCKDKVQKRESDIVGLRNKEKVKKGTVVLEGFGTPETPEDKSVDIPIAKPKFKQVGKMNLEDLKPKKAPKKEEPAVEKPAEEPIKEVETLKLDSSEVASVAEAPVAEAPVAEVPVAEAPVAEAPVAEEPVAEAPVVEEPVVETPKEASVVESPADVVPEVVTTVEKTTATDVPAEEVKPEAEKPKALTDKDELEAKAEEGDASDKGGIFTTGTSTLKSSINVVGKIDLSAINQQTRPKKKSKEEKKKELDDKQAAKKAKVVKGNDERKKRSRISKERIDVNKPYGANGSASNNRGPAGAGANRSNPNNRTSPNNRNTPNRTAAKARPGKNRRSLAKAPLSEEDVQKQVKETLAMLTNKVKSKGAKYRKGKREAASQRKSEEREQLRKEGSVIKITEFVTVNELSVMMDVPVTSVIGTCMNLGLVVSINQRLDAETINIVADEFGFKTEYVSADVSENIEVEEDKPEDLISRPPIVTIMGHVDHGKTSLLDHIRKANVIAGEAGGITQHIGAYNVKLENGQHITFLDTPGHEAFTAMRARGAQVTDIAIIIIAADDNVMPQTIEAINHASAANVPIVFAINKVDKPVANPEKIKESLAAMNYLVEDWGGKYQSHDISSKTGMGVNELLEKVLLEAEVLELKANPKKKAIGSVVESSLDKGRGYLATVLVEGGTLQQGDVVLSGTTQGKIKAMFNERNQRIECAKPGEPALLLGLDGAPQAGEKFHVLGSEHEAREMANKREQLQREQSLRTKKHLTLDDIGRRIALGSFQELNVIVKGDVDGSIEALSDALIKLSTPEIQVNVIHKAVGEISESDVMLAAASNAIVVGFQVRPSQAARRQAEREEIDIRLYSIIYDVIEEIKAAMEGMLSPEIKEEITATLEVLQAFKITKVGTVAGCLVRDGKIKRSNKIRLIRDGIVVYSGELGSLKRMKDDVKEVANGYECGLNITNYNDIKVGDLVESYEETEVKKKL